MSDNAAPGGDRASAWQHPVRPFFRQLSPEELTAMGELDHLMLGEAEATELLGPVTELLRTIEELLTVPGLEPEVSTHATRDIGRRPAPHEDPFNAFIRICEVLGASEGALHGKTIAVKDNIDVAGIPTTNASATTAFTPTHDATVVERILETGGRIVGKLNMDDFAAGASGETSAYGPPLNPRDPTRSAGGSSGGSGSAVASGAVDLSLGVDQAGSARIPASFCGVVAIKATHGLIPTPGITHLDHTLDAICPMARTVAEAATLLEAIAGEDWRDPQWVRERIPTDWTCRVTEDVKGLRIGVIDESTDPQLCSTDVLENLEHSAAALERSGATLDRVSIPIWTRGLPIIQTLLCHLVGAMIKSEGVGYGHLGYIDVDRLHTFAVARRVENSLLPPYMKVWMLVERYLHDSYLNVTYGVLQNLRLRLRREIEQAFEEHDVLLTPTTPCTAPRLLGNDELVSSGVLSHILKSLPYNTAPLNLSGHPAIAVPNGEDGAGLPTSLQIASRPFEEEVAARVAHSVEIELGRG